MSNIITYGAYKCLPTYRSLNIGLLCRPFREGFSIITYTLKNFFFVCSFILFVCVAVFYKANTSLL